MKKILLVGNSPLPTENTKSLPAAGLRTYQFLKPLISSIGQGSSYGGTVIEKAEHAFSAKKSPNLKICLVTIALPECYDDEPPKKDIVYSEYYRHFSISKNDPALYSEIQKVHDEFMPDAIIGVNTFSSSVAASLRSTAPLWADLNGWIMAEAQAQAYKTGTNSYIPHYYEMEAAVLRRADKISCVSLPQKYAVIGELAVMGRLVGETFGYEFVCAIANGTEEFEGEEAGMTEGGERGTRGRRGMRAWGMTDIPHDAFILAFIGGYNTWVDELTLFNGVAEAMEKCEKLYFVSTGGEIPGLDNKTFSRFKKMADDSKFKNRFIFLGWVNTSDIPYIYARANAGLNVDRKCAETFTGARNRINEMMKFGVPVITTLGSEISYEVVKYGAGVGVGGKEAHEVRLADAIIRMYDDRKDDNGRKLKEYGENGRKYIREKCNYDYLMKPLFTWLENPRPAPDRGIHLEFGNGFSYAGVISKVRGAFTYLKNNGIRKFLKKLRQRI